MPNERETERLVRAHFSAYAEEVTVEEQQSQSQRIAKLLRGTSKSGAGQGRPDFIVQFAAEPELLAVVECKAQTGKHESADRDAPAEYAVDGALYYASHLSRGFDVLAIAVSGVPGRARVPTSCS